MSENREETVRQFCDVTGADETRSKFFLESANWRLEVSDSRFFKSKLFIVLLIYQNCSVIASPGSNIQFLRARRERGGASRTAPGSASSSSL